MTELLLLLTMIAVTWLALWSRDEGGQGGWSPFDMRAGTRKYPLDPLPQAGGEKRRPHYARGR
jgi:hypothetical protein